MTEVTRTYIIVLGDHMHEYPPGRPTQWRSLAAWTGTRWKWRRAGAEMAAREYISQGAARRVAARLRPPKPQHSIYVVEKALTCRTEYSLHAVVKRSPLVRASRSPREFRRGWMK